MATGFNTQVSKGEYRLQFETDNKEYYLLMQETARRCVDGKPVTNADRIRSMTDEELSVFLREKFDCRSEPCPGIELCKPNEGKANGIFRWLLQPAE